MKNICTDNLTGRVITYPENAEATPRDGWVIREVTPAIQAVLDQGGPFRWGEGVLTKVNRPSKPLRERLRLVVKSGSFPASVRAGFPFERVAYWLDQGDVEAAKEVINSIDVSGKPAKIQAAKSALLAEFDS